MAYNYKKQQVDKSKLLKVGFEGFETLEQEYPGGTKGCRHQKTKKVPVCAAAANYCLYQYQPQQTQVYQVTTTNPVSATVPVDMMINSYEAMKLHDGRLVFGYSRTKSAAVA